MRIVLATPLYPPDIAEPAPYIKELARRLAIEHEVVITTYGRFVEPLPGVRFVRVDKRHLLPFRLIRFFLSLMREIRTADLLYLENGPSVELPAVAASVLTGTPLILHIGDETADARASAGGLLSFIQSLARKRARRVIETRPGSKPEIIPFLPRPAEKEAAYQLAWERHIAEVKEALHHA